MTATRDEYLIQKSYGGIWMNFDDIFPDLQSAKYRIKNLNGEFRIFKRTVTNWEEVKQ